MVSVKGPWQPAGLVAVHRGTEKLQQGKLEGLHMTRVDREFGSIRVEKIHVLASGCMRMLFNRSIDLDFEEKQPGNQRSRLYQLRKT